MKPKVSIIIPVRTITNYLRDAIPHLKKLKYSNYEVLIITDEEEIFRGLPKNFKMIPSGKVGPSDKRNLALRYASGKILAFLDDDAYPRSDWLEKATSDFSDKNLCGVGGPSITPPNEGFLEKVSGEILSSALAGGGTYHRHVVGKRMYVDDYPSVNLFVLFSDFKKVGGFKSEFWPGEDTKLCLDLLEETGKKILYDPLVVVFHHRRTVFLPHLKQVSRYGMHRGQFAKIFPKNSRKLQYFVPSLFILGLFFGPLTFFFSRFFFYFYFSVVGLYVILLLNEAVKVFSKEKNILLTFYFIMGVFLTHLVYGFYFLYGLFKKPKLNLKAVSKKEGKYIEG